MGFLSHRILCAIAGRCDAGDKALARAYGDADAALLRRYAPDIVYEPGERSLPVDFRQCRMRRCAEAPDDPDLDAHRTGSGLPAVAFTRVIRRGGSTYLQYWFYYPDSNSRFAGSDRAWDATAGKLGLGGYPGYHRDDWEGYQVRLGAGGGVDVRASSHGHYQWCKQEECNNRWGPRTGWTRVSSGSHAGHVPLERETEPRRPPGDPRRAHRYSYEPQLPGHDLHERTTTGEGLRLVPLETIDRRSYRPLDDDIDPPWSKPVYDDPESGES